jgi:hypothetical protein
MQVFVHDKSHFEEFAGGNNKTVRGMWLASTCFMTFENLLAQ